MGYRYQPCPRAGANPCRPPGWLLPTPRPLPIRHGHPWHSETIACQGQPERLETGWWDGQRVTRDYWIGQGESGAVTGCFRIEVAANGF